MTNDKYQMTNKFPHQNGVGARGGVFWCGNKSVNDKSKKYFPDLGLNDLFGFCHLDFGFIKLFLLLIPTLLLFSTVSHAALPFQSEINKGNDSYKKQLYEKAESVYSSILQKNQKDQKAKFNLGDSLYKQGRFSESLKVFETLTAEAKSNQLKEYSFYNLGNSKFKQENYKGAIASYEEALKIDPKDQDAKFNLELAKKMLENPPKPKGKDKDKKKDENKKNESRKSEEMSKEDAERILKALQNQEKHKNKEEKKGFGPGQPDKDW